MQEPLEAELGVTIADLECLRMFDNIDQLEPP